MSSAANFPNPNTSIAMPIKNEITTFAVVVSLDPNGKVAKSRITSSEKAIAELEKTDYTGDEQIAFKQSVVSPKVGTIEGFLELIKDPEEQINIINRGIGSKFSQKINTALKEVDEAGNLVFQPVEPTYDATPLIQEPAMRSNLSPVDKALKTLGALNLSAEALAAIFAELAAANGAQTEAVSE